MGHDQKLVQEGADRAATVLREYKLLPSTEAQDSDILYIRNIFRDFVHYCNQHQMNFSYCTGSALAKAVEDILGSPRNLDTQGVVDVLRESGIAPALQTMQDDNFPLRLMLENEDKDSLAEHENVAKTKVA